MPALSVTVVFTEQVTLPGFWPRLALTALESILALHFFWLASKPVAELELRIIAFPTASFVLSFITSILMLFTPEKLSSKVPSISISAPKFVNNCLLCVDLRLGVFVSTLSEKLE